MYQRKEEKGNIKKNTLRFTFYLSILALVLFIVSYDGFDLSGRRSSGKAAAKTASHKRHPAGGLHAFKSSPEARKFTAEKTRAFELPDVESAYPGLIKKKTRDSNGKRCLEYYRNGRRHPMIREYPDEKIRVFYNDKDNNRNYEVPLYSRRQGFQGLPFIINNSTKKNVYEVYHVDFAPWFQDDYNYGKVKEGESLVITSYKTGESLLGEIPYKREIFNPEGLLIKEEWGYISKQNPKDGGFTLSFSSDKLKPIKFEPVRLKGNILLVEGKPYQIRGLTYSPGTVGQDSKTLKFEYATVKNDIKLMKELGVNTVRTYYPIEDERIFDLFADAGIKVIIGIPYFDDRYNPGPDVKRGTCVDYIKKFKKHPAILFWEFGNEYDLLAEMHPDWFEGDIGNWHKALRKTVAKVRKIDPSHPIATAIANNFDLTQFRIAREIEGKDIIKSLEENLNITELSKIASAYECVDIIGVNAYIWDNPTLLIKNWQKISHKPMYFAEAGVDSYDIKKKAFIEDLQSDLVERIWIHINRNSSIFNSSSPCLGVTFMTFADEWWKHAKDIYKLEPEAGFIHDPVPPDGYANEQSWGWVDARRRKKAVFQTMKNQWNDSASLSKEEIKPVVISYNAPFSINELLQHYNSYPLKTVKNHYNGRLRTGRRMLIHKKNEETPLEYNSHFENMPRSEDSKFREVITDRKGGIISVRVYDEFKRPIEVNIYTGSEKYKVVYTYDKSSQKLITRKVYLDKIRNDRLLFTVRELPMTRLTEVIPRPDPAKLNISYDVKEKEDWDNILRMYSIDPVLEPVEKMSSLDGVKEISYYMTGDFKSRKLLTVSYHNDQPLSYNLLSTFGKSEDEASIRYKLNPDFEITEKFIKKNRPVSLEMIINGKVSNEYSEMDEEGAGLRKALESIGISEDTRINTYLRYSKLIRTDSSGDPYYDSEYGSPDLLYYPYDYPENPERLLAKRENDGSLVLYPIWWTGKTKQIKYNDKVITRTFPAGISPGSIKFDSRGSLEELRIFNGEVIQPYEYGKRAYSYKILKGSTSESIIITPYGKKLAKISDYSVTKLANGILGQAFSGREFLFFEPFSKVDVPRIGIVTYIDHKSGTKKSFVSKRFQKTIYSGNEKKFQASTYLVRERDPVAPEKVYINKYYYENGRLISKSRIDIVDNWLKDKSKAINLTKIIFIVILSILVSGELLSLIRKNRASVSDNNSEEKVLPRSLQSDEYLESFNRHIEGLDCYGFAPEICRKAKKLTREYVKRRLKRLKSPEEIIGEHFQYFRKWYENVYERHFKRVEKLDFNALTIDDIYLYYLIYLSSGIFSNSTPAFLNFLFLSYRKTAPGGHEQAYDRIREEISGWSEILEKNIGLQKNTGREEDYLTYNDVEDYFNTPMFLRLYERNRDRLGEFLKGVNEKLNSDKNSLRKTYPDISSGFLGIKGIYSIVTNFKTPALVLLLICYGISLIFLPFNEWVYGLAAVILLFPAGKAVAKSLNNARGQEPIPPHKIRPEKKDSLNKREEIVGSLFWTVIISAKLIWNYFLFENLKAPTSILLRSKIGDIGGSSIILTLILLVPFLIFFILDTFTFFFIGQSIFSYLKGKWSGSGCIKSWSVLEKDFDNIGKKFIEKIIPAKVRLSKKQKETAWYHAWNMIIENLYQNDKLNDDERELYKFHYDFDKKSFTGKLRILPDLSREPVNEEAGGRILSFASSMYMDMPKPLRWQDLYSFSVMVPVYNESVIYTWEELNGVENTSTTRLSHLVEQYTDEWKNFINRMSKKDYPEDEIEKLGDFGPGSSLQLLNQELIRQVRLWASYRFQPLSRTIRGITTYVDAVKFMARLNHPDYDDHRLMEKVRENFQAIVGYQIYAELPESDQRIVDLKYLMKENPILEVAYIDKRERKGSEIWFSVLIRYDETSGSIVEKSRIELPGNPITGEGKPCNQNNILKHVTGEKVQFLDSNQDLYFEENLKVYNLLEEFRQDPKARIIGFPEEIFTSTYNTIAGTYAFADEVFSGFVQRFLSAVGVRLHYGHPDFIDANFLRHTGTISPSEVNEDIFGGYKTLLYGYRSIFREYIKAGKAREVSFLTSSIFFSKLGMGAAQQGMSRWIKRFLSSPSIPLSKKLTHTMVLGYFLRKPLVSFGILTYLFLVLLLGVSGFAALPSEVIFGIIAIIFAEAIMLNGLLHLISSKGIIKGTIDFINKFFLMTPVFMAHIFLFDCSVRRGIHGKAKYLATGRGWMLHHVPFFSSKDKETDVHTLCSHYYFTIPFICIVIGAFGIILWKNINLIWSLFFIISPLTALTVPFIANPGSLPVDKEYRYWPRLILSEWLNWLKKAGKKTVEIFRTSSLKRSLSLLYNLFSLFILGILNLSLITFLGLVIYTLRIIRDTFIKAYKSAFSINKDSLEKISKMN